MSRAIKVEDQVYLELDNLRIKGQTFSQVIGDLLSGRLAVLEFLNVLEGKLKFHEWQQQQIRRLQEIDTGGDRSEVSHLLSG